MADAFSPSVMADAMPPPSSEGGKCWPPLRGGCHEVTGGVLAGPETLSCGLWKWCERSNGRGPVGWLSFRTSVIIPSSEAISNCQRSMSAESCSWVRGFLVLNRVPSSETN